MKTLLRLALVLLTAVGSAKLCHAATKIYSGSYLDGKLYSTDSVTAATTTIATIQITV